MTSHVFLSKSISPISNDLRGSKSYVVFAYFLQQFAKKQCIVFIFCPILFSHNLQELSIQFRPTIISTVSGYKTKKELTSENEDSRQIVEWCDVSLGLHVEMSGGTEALTHFMHDIENNREWMFPEVTEDGQDDENAEAFNWEGHRHDCGRNPDGSDLPSHRRLSASGRLPRGRHRRAASC